MAARPELPPAPRRVRSTWRGWALRVGLGLPALSLAAFAFWEVGTNAQSLRRNLDPELRSNGRVVQGRVVSVDATDCEWTLRYEVGGIWYEGTEAIDASRAEQVAAEIAIAEPSALDVLRAFEGTATPELDVLRGELARRVTVHYRRGDPTVFQAQEHGRAAVDDWSWTFGSIVDVTAAQHVAEVAFTMDGVERSLSSVAWGVDPPERWPPVGGAVEVLAHPGDPANVVSTLDVPAVSLALDVGNLEGPLLGVLAALVLVAFIEFLLWRGRRILMVGREGRATVLAIEGTRNNWQNSFTALASAVGDRSLPSVTTFIVHYGFLLDGTRHDGRAHLSQAQVAGLVVGGGLSILVPPEGAGSEVVLSRPLTWARVVGAEKGRARPRRKSRSRGSRARRAPHARVAPSRNPT